MIPASALDPSWPNGNAEAKAIAMVKAAVFLNQEGAQSRTALYTTSSFHLADPTRILAFFTS